MLLGESVLFELVGFLKRYMGGLLLILSDGQLVISATRPKGRLCGVSFTVC